MNKFQFRILLIEYYLELLHKYNHNHFFYLQEALAQICEYSEAGITVRGTYVITGKEPKEGERKLYLAIEATTELAISKAKKEVTRLIKDELIRLVSVHLVYIFEFLCYMSSNVPPVEQQFIL